MFCRLFIFLNLVCLSAPANALTGEELLQHCDGILRAWGNSAAKVSDFQSGKCVGYLTGVVEMNELDYQDRGSGRKPRFCPPDYLGNEQVVRIVAKHLREHPELLHFSAVSQSMLALGRAFPCR
jgi:DNA-binding transcriptional LysR family regulator